MIDVKVLSRCQLGNHKIDLSKKAANEVDLIREQGTMPVKNEVAAWRRAAKLLEPYRIRQRLGTGASCEQNGPDQFGTFNL